MPNDMQIKLNGRPRTVAPGSSLVRLLSELGLPGEHVVVEHNGQIVPPDHWSRTVIRVGDTVEFVHLVGGG